jgi:hypothetical protein
MILQIARINGPVDPAKTFDHIRSVFSEAGLNLPTLTPNASTTAH